MIDNPVKTATRNEKLWVDFIMCLCWCLMILVADSQLTDPVEVSALRSVRQSLTDPFRRLSSWNRGDPCTSNWSGILCYNTTLDDGYLHIEELVMLNRNLSGILSPELGRFSYLRILDFMWNNITGSIPREIGNISTLALFLVNGNQLTGSLPDEMGYLYHLDRIQIDQNHISGPIPSSFANLNTTRHFHMNNNSLSGQIPPELSRLPNLVHLLLDNNNLSGYIPSGLSEIPTLQIIQLDNNNFSGSRIPSSLGNISRLLKLSLRNCSLQGPVPDWSTLPSIAYIDLSLNQLDGPIPNGTLSQNITIVDLSSNSLNGTLPASFTSLPRVQKLSVANNSLSGSISSFIWLNRTLNPTERLFMDFGNNMFSNITNNPIVPPNVTIGLQGNPVCPNSNLIQACGPHVEQFDTPVTVGITTINGCSPQSCPTPYEISPAAFPFVSCFCAAPLYIGYRLKSPGFLDFLPYVEDFRQYLSSGLRLNLSQLELDSVVWQSGPRLRMNLKIFPAYVNNRVRLFNNTEIRRIRNMFGGWEIPDSPIFGPYELLNFTRSELYDGTPSSRSGLSTSALVGIVVGAIAGTVMISSIVGLLVLRLYIRKHPIRSKKRKSSRPPIKIDGVKDFTYAEMALATNNFSSVVGQGGYGKVYKGVLADGTVVAIKRAQEGSLQGETEFLTEIELLSRLHHRNLVSLVGFCDEEGEQMLIYEYMPNGTLRDLLSGKSKPTFTMRVRIALGSSKGILYLHTEADPPIFHRDIKANNILLDAKLTAKVADFGLSKLAPAPELEGDLPSHVSTVVKGTPGYLDPEYFATHKLTDKSDVYSLGVVFLELLTGMYPIHHGKNIVREVNTAYRSGMMFTIVDEHMGPYLPECVEKFMKLALKCCQEETDSRPSMAQVVRELDNIWLMMPESDTKISESTVSEPGKVMTPPSSSTSSKNPYLLQDNDLYPYSSQDISGSELVTGGFNTFQPR